MANVRVTDIQPDEVHQLALLLPREIRDRRARIVDDHVVFEKLGEVVVLGFLRFENRLGELRIGQRSHYLEPQLLFVLQYRHTLVFA